MADQVETTSSSSREAAPGELAHVESFVNTHHYPAAEHEVERELLTSPEDLRDWFAGRGWLAADAHLTDADLQQALEVREALRSLLLANNGGELDEAAVESLNRAAKSAEILVRFHDDGRSELAAARSGIDGALGQLLAIVFRAMAEGTWERLKACPYESCFWAFYDYSKNRSGTWCSMAVCGNRAKAHAYRERRRGKGAASA